MTCILAWIDKENNRVIVGADSIATSDWEVFPMAETKIWKPNDNMIVGVSGTVRLHNLLRHCLELPKYKPKDDPLKYMIQSVVPAIRELLEAHGALTLTQENINTINNNAILFAIDGRVFVIYEDLQVLETTRPYAAIGSGWCYAMGAAYAIRDTHSDHDGPDCYEAIKSCLDAAKALSPTCGGETVFLVT